MMSKFETDREKLQEWSKTEIPSDGSAAFERKMLGDEAVEAWNKERVAAGQAPIIGVDRASIELQDSTLAEGACKGLGDVLCWASGIGWLHYDAGRWVEASEATAIEMFRLKLKELHKLLSERALEPEHARKAATLLSAAKVKAVTYFARGLLEKRADEFDHSADLLNVANGTIHLPTGTLQAHNPDDLLTKISPIDYVPGATHDDWRVSLDALPADVRGWFQVRVGQAATGYMTDDDVLPVLQGNGSNGKSTILNGIMSALGDHGVAVPERVLLASSADHPTELTTLMGARTALIEELPEGRQLSTKRLKDTLGTPRMTARKIRQDNVSWNATHSLFLTTNYRPVVSETDHGTWRRLALVTFPYTYRAPGEALSTASDRTGDPRLRDRMSRGEDGQLEAVLAWIVEGSKAWYTFGKAQMAVPDTVAADTLAWREESDLILAFVNERLEFDPSSAVLKNDLYSDFTKFLEDRGHSGWTDKTFTARFEMHDSITKHAVKTSRPKTVPANVSRPRVDSWLQNAVPQRPILYPGVKFRD